MAAPVWPCISDSSSAFPPMEMNKTHQVQPGEQPTASYSQRKKSKRDTKKVNPPIPAPMNKKTICPTQLSSTALNQVTSRSNSNFSIVSQQNTTDNLSKQEDPNVNFASSTKSVAVPSSDSVCLKKKSPEHMAWSVNKRKLSEKDRVTQDCVLPKSGVDAENTCVYTSKVILGPLGSSGTPVSQILYALQPEAQTEATVGVPSIITLLSSCPQYSRICGMPSLRQSHVAAWPDSGLLFQKSPSQRSSLLLYSDYVDSNHENSTGIVKMVDIMPSCSRSSCIPGFPSALKCVSNITHLLPTCALVCTVPGLASVQLLTGFKTNVWNRHLLWKKPLKIKDELVSYVSCVQEQAGNTYRDMVAILPTCSSKASVPGFPSAPLMKVSVTPSMASLLSTCPKHTVIEGIPFTQGVRYNENWHVLKNILDRQIKSNIVLVQEKIYKDTEYIKHMVNMLPSCPWKKTIPGFPSVPQKPQGVSGVQFAPQQDSSVTCQKKNTGLASQDQVSAQFEGLDVVSHIVMENPLSTVEDLTHNIFSGTVEGLCSCPIRPSLVGLSNEPKNIVSLVSMCPEQSQTPGMLCKYQNSFENKDWDDMRRIINKSPEKKTQVCVDQWIQEYTKNHGVVEMFISCPAKARVFGLPCAPQLTFSMANVMPSCPRHSGVSGLPSKLLSLSSCKEWFAYKCLQCKSPLIKKEVKILNSVLYFDKDTAQSMVQILPSCPDIARAPGFPSALTQRLSNCPSVVNLLPCCTEKSRVPGLPLKNSPKSFEWVKEDMWLLLPRKGSAVPLQLDDINVVYIDCDMVINMVSILPTCPQTVCLPGFPSVLCLSADLPKVFQLLPACPRHTGVFGIPSRVCIESDEAEWTVDKWPVLERVLTRLPVIYEHGMHFREKSVITIMLSMLPPCPKHSNISGMPCKTGESQVEALVKEAPSMLKCSATLPKNSTIPGLPAKNIAKEYDAWFVAWDAVCEISFKTRYGFVNQDPTNKGMSYRDKELMLSRFAVCPQQALTPGFPSAPHPQVVDAVVEKNPDMVQLMPVCPRQSSIIGFPSIISDFIVGVWPVAMIKTLKRHGSKKDVIRSLEPSCPDIYFKSVMPSEVDRLSDMVNIVSSCPKNTSVVGLPSICDPPWVKSETKKTGKESLCQQLPLEEQSFNKVCVRETSMHFILPGQDLLDNLQQRMTAESSTCLIEAIVQEFSSSYPTKIQGNPLFSTVEGTEKLCEEASPSGLDLDSKKTMSAVHTPFEKKIDEQIPVEAEEVAVLEKG